MLTLVAALRRFFNYSAAIVQGHGEHFILKLRAYRGATFRESFLRVFSYWITVLLFHPCLH